MKNLKRIIGGYRPHTDKWYYWVLRDILILLNIIKRNTVRFSCKSIAILRSKIENRACFPRIETIEDDD